MTVETNNLVDTSMNDNKKTAIEAAVFQRLLKHLDEHKEVQNIDLMNLAGFCRNCLSRWYLEAAAALDVELEYEDARETVYGMPYADWKHKYQTEASADQLTMMKARHEDG